MRILSSETPVNQVLYLMKYVFKWGRNRLYFRFLFCLFDISHKDTKMTKKMDTQFFQIRFNHLFNFFYLLQCLNLAWFPKIYFSLVFRFFFRWSFDLLCHIGKGYLNITSICNTHFDKTLIQYFHFKLFFSYQIIYRVLQKNIFLKDSSVKKVWFLSVL